MCSKTLENTRKMSENFMKPTVKDVVPVALASPITSNASLQQEPDPLLSPARQNLRKWLGKTFRVAITDGRVLVGFFNCTDKDANVVLSMCAEYLEEGKDARILGNVMIPGKHIVSIAVDMAEDDAKFAQLRASTAEKTKIHKELLADFI